MGASTVFGGVDARVGLRNKNMRRKCVDSGCFPETMAWVSRKLLHVSRRSFPSVRMERPLMGWDGEEESEDSWELWFQWAASAPGWRVMMVTTVSWSNANIAVTIPKYVAVIHA